MKHYLHIGDENFEIKSSVVCANSYGVLSGKNLDDCYRKPSTEKTEIWNKWKKWAIDNDVKYFGIRGFNKEFFTLDFKYVDEKGTEWYGVIKPTKQEVSILSYD